jgi:hypothetical protein
MWRKALGFSALRLLRLPALKAALRATLTAQLFVEHTASTDLLLQKENRAASRNSCQRGQVKMGRAGIRHHAPFQSNLALTYHGIMAI